jgi:hypothetical protein
VQKPDDEQALRPIFVKQKIIREFPNDPLTNPRCVWESRLHPQLRMTNKEREGVFNGVTELIRSHWV